MIRLSRLLLWVMLFTAAGLAWPSDAAAQRSAPRGRSTGAAVPRTYPVRYYRPYYYSHYYYPRYYYPGYHYPYYSAYYYSPWYYSPYYSSFGFSVGFGWPGAYWGPYGHSYGYPYPYYWYDNTGSVRLHITPRNAQVYVDGRFVGLVDQFDGSLQRLRVDSGQHEVQVYHEGYRSLTQKVLFTRGTTLKIEGALQPLNPGEPAEPKPAPDPATPSPDRYERPPAPPSRAGEQGEFGTLSVRVNPADAVILIDGEVWERPAGDNRFSIDLAEGLHQVEIRKDGHRPYVRSVDVRRGRTFTLNVSLTP
jgi:PEGA domain